MKSSRNVAITVERHVRDIEEISRDIEETWEVQEMFKKRYRDVQESLFRARIFKLKRNFHSLLLLKIINLFTSKNVIEVNVCWIAPENQLFKDY